MTGSYGNERVEAALDDNPTGSITVELNNPRCCAVGQPMIETE